MDRQARSGYTVLVKRREPNTALVAWRRGVKTTENKIHWPRWLGSFMEDNFLMTALVVCRDSAPLDDKLADRVKITSKGNLFTLSLTGCQPGDSGQYTCRSIIPSF
jgi:hypothetical protein